MERSRSDQRERRRQFENCVELVKQANEELKNAKNQGNQTLEKHRSLIDKVEDFLRDVRPVVDELSALRKTKWLLEHFEQIRQAHNRLETQIDTEQLSDLRESFEALAKPCIELSQFKCNGFDLYGEKVLAHWKDQLLKRLPDEFKQCFRRVNWPRMPAIKQQSTTVPLPSSLETFKQFVRILIVIDNARIESPSKADAAPNKICYPIRLMLEPIKHQCLFDFLVSRKTNRLDKPEWCTNLALKWINENTKFIRDIVDPIVGNYSHYVSAFTQFVACIIELVLERLEVDVSKIASGLAENEHNPDSLETYEKLFVHTASETLSFTKEIIGLLGDDDYHQLDETFDIMAAFSTGDNFERIMKTERTRAREHFMNIINSSTAWSLMLEDSYEDEYMITECVDRLVILIGSISERADCYRRVECQHAMIELQCNLFTKFIDALHQIDAPDSVTSMLRPAHEVSRLQWKLRDPYFQIMNGVNFIRGLFHERSFLSQHIQKNIKPRSNIDMLLTSSAQKYSDLFEHLMGKTIKEFDASDCTLSHFVNWIKPRVPKLLFDSLKDEATTCFEAKLAKKSMGR